MSISVSGASQQKLLVQLMREAAVANATGAASAMARASVVPKASSTAPVEPVDASSGFSVSPQIMSFLSRLGGKGGSGEREGSVATSATSSKGADLARMLVKVDAVLSAYAANSGSSEADADDTTSVIV